MMNEYDPKKVWDKIIKKQRKLLEVKVNTGEEWQTL